MMRITTYIKNQLIDIDAIFSDIVKDISDKEWTSRAAPRLNLLGFIAWHVPRTRDSLVQTWIRAIPEVAHTARWEGWRNFRRMGIGAGIQLHEADEIAHTVKKADVLAYAEEVAGEFYRWLDTIPESDLEAVLNIRERLAAYPEYRTPGFLKESQDHFDEPVWEILMATCIGHIHRHLGEIDTITRILRA